MQSVAGVNDPLNLPFDKSEEPIPFNKPFIVGKELYYISQAVQAGRLAGDGHFTKMCHHWLETRFSFSRAFLTHSCTAALEMACILIDLKEGDEVIVPSYTFVSTANAFVLRGARPAFVDIRDDTLNMDERQVEAAVSPKTRAIIPVHYAGVAVDMDSIMAVADRYSLVVIEDAAHALGATYRGRSLGTLGHFGAFSFHETKNYISGEGGALMVNRKDLEPRAEIVREKGTNRSAFFRGEVDKYSWVDVGSSFLPSELVAAFLYAQLEHAPEIDARRMAIYDAYREGLNELQERGLARLPHIPPECEHTAHMFYLICDGLETRSRLIEYMKRRGIHCVFHYVPLHASVMGRKFGFRQGQFPVTEAISDCLVRLPIFYDMTALQHGRVIEGVRSFFGLAGL